MRICGLDECGRGPLAGPIVAAAVALNYKSQITNLNDSKKLSEKQREKIYEELIKTDCTIGIEIISVRQINSRGIGWANKEVFRRLIKKIEADKYIVDGSLKILVRGKSNKIKSIIKADATRKCVMAASIIAKVTRDRLMKELHKEHPQYGWISNMGYGTKYHISAITEFGTVKYHRKIFVETALKNMVSPPSHKATEGHNNNL